MAIALGVTAWDGRRIAPTIAPISAKVPELINSSRDPSRRHKELGCIQHRLHGGLMTEVSAKGAQAHRQPEEGVSAETTVRVRPLLPESPARLGSSPGAGRWPRGAPWQKRSPQVGTSAACWPGARSGQSVHVGQGGLYDHVGGRVRHVVLDSAVPAGHVQAFAKSRHFGSPTRLL